MDVEVLSKQFSGWQLSADRTTQLRATLRRACPNVQPPDEMTVTGMLQVLESVPAASDDSISDDDDDLHVAALGAGAVVRRRRGSGSSGSSNLCGDDADDEMEMDDGMDDSNVKLDHQRPRAAWLSAPLLYLSWDHEQLTALDCPVSSCPGGTTARDSQLADVGLHRGTPTRHAVATVLTARLPALQRGRDLLWRDPTRAGTVFKFPSLKGLAKARHALGKALPYARGVPVQRRQGYALARRLHCRRTSGWEDDGSLDS